MTELHESKYNKILVISPHPYDAELWAGGTIKTFINNDKAVHWVICTDGAKTSNNPNVKQNELKQIRHSEQIQAAEALGTPSLSFLDLRDGELEDTDSFRKLIVRQIRKEQPDLVITSEPYRKNLSWHRDHRITGQVSLDAVYPYGRDHLHYQDLWENESLEPHNTRAIWFWGTENPDICVNISQTFDDKITALMSHKTQVFGKTEQDIRHQITSRADSASPDVELSESFREVTFRV